MELTSDDLLSGDEAAIRAKVESYVNEKVKEAAAGGFSTEKQAEVDEVKKDFSVFADEDEEIREVAEAMLLKAVKALPETAGKEDYKKAAEQVSKKLAKVCVEKDAGNKKDIPSPAQMQGGSAAAAHVQAEVPKTIDEAEALADKIAADFTGK